MFNSTDTLQDHSFSFLFVFACILIILTIVGNILVIVAFAKEPSLQVLTNYWIVSLSCTDLVLATMVMPVYIVDEVNGDTWKFGQLFCDVFITMDVLCCTCSIYHLVLISLDRYFCVRHPLTYPKRRTRRSTLIAITGTWLICAVISVPRLMGWKDPSRADECRLTNTSYKIFSSMMSFFIPTLLIIWTYLSIYIMTQQQARRIQKYSTCGKQSVPAVTFQEQPESSMQNGPQSCFEIPKTSVQASDSNCSLNRIEEDTSVPDAEPMTSIGLLQLPTLTDSPAAPVQRTASFGRGSGLRKKFRLSSVSSFDYESTRTSSAGSFIAQKLSETLVPKRFLASKTAALSRLERNRQKQEQKAAKVVTIVVTVFLVCWTPFFALNVYDAVRQNVSPVAWRTVTWLGYANSAVNPVIYTLFNRTFRQTIIQILGCGRNELRFRRTRRVVIE